jgi:hypothetical protein
MNEEMQTKENMNGILNNCSFTTWHQLLSELPWNPESAERSATIALSKAKWLGISQDDAIDTILNLPAAPYLRENRHLLYAIWECVSREMDGEPTVLLEPEPIFDAAA